MLGNHTTLLQKDLRHHDLFPMDKLARELLVELFLWQATPVEILHGSLRVSWTATTNSAGLTSHPHSASENVTNQWEREGEPLPVSNFSAANPALRAVCSQRTAAALNIPPTSARSSTRTTSPFNTNGRAIRTGREICSVTCIPTCTSVIVKKQAPEGL